MTWTRWIASCCQHHLVQLSAGDPRMAAAFLGGSAAGPTFDLPGLPALGRPGHRDSRCVPKGQQMPRFLGVNWMDLDGFGLRFVGWISSRIWPFGIHTPRELASIRVFNSGVPCLVEGWKYQPTSPWYWSRHVNKYHNLQTILCEVHLRI